MAVDYSSAMIDRAWSDVRQHRRVSGDLTVFELDLEVAGGKVLLGVDENGFRRILFPLGPGGPCKDDVRSMGVQISLSELLDGSIRTSFVEVVCKRPSLNDLFCSMTSEILNLIAEDQSRPDLKAGIVLDRWRSLLRADNSRGLELNEVIGLMGELIVLEQIANRGFTDLDVWTGPDKLPHDFTLPSGSVEVKTTTAAAGWRVQIHGTRQLELPARGDLILTAVRLERSPLGTRHIADQIERLIASGVSSDALWQKLNLLDIYEEPAERLTEHRFNFRESVAFTVDSSFPRIAENSFTTGSLPDEIVDLRYTVDLTGREHSETDQLLSPLLIESKGQ